MWLVERSVNIEDSVWWDTEATFDTADEALAFIKDKFDKERQYINDLNEQAKAQFDLIVKSLKKRNKVLKAAGLKPDYIPETPTVYRYYDESDNWRIWNTEI